jgi:hypothetical protein
MEIFLIVIALIITLFILFIYYGGMTIIKPEVKRTGGEFLAYQKVTGNYRQSGSISDKVYSELIDKLKIGTYKGFGIYYDDPKSVPVEELRSDVGCIIEKKDLERINEVRKIFEVKELSVKNYLVVEFPYRGSFFIIIGILKVYPLLKKTTILQNLDSNGYVMEIWDIPNKKIIYRKEI